MYSYIYVPSLLCAELVWAELVMCRVGYMPSLLCAELAQHWYDYRCWSLIFLGTIHSPAHDLEIKVTDLPIIYVFMEKLAKFYVILYILTSEPVINFGLLQVFWRMSVL